MANAGNEIAFKKETIAKLLTRSFKEDKTKVSSDAVILVTEMLKVFVEEATRRAVKQASIEDCDTVDIEHFEKILPQLFSSLLMFQKNIDSIVFLHVFRVYSTSKPGPAPDRRVGAALEPVFPAENWFFGCRNTKNWLARRHRLRTGSQNALVEKGLECLPLITAAPS
ncbi:centromere protein X [Pimephales promelas]|nr:centromere protein X [Pimephales promelas]